MTIALQCSCGANLQLADAAAGRRVKCPKCAGAVHVPLSWVTIVEGAPPPPPGAPAPSPVQDRTEPLEIASKDRPWEVLAAMWILMAMMILQLAAMSGPAYVNPVQPASLLVMIAMFAGLYRQALWGWWFSAVFSGLVTVSGLGWLVALPFLSSSRSLPVLALLPMMLFAPLLALLIAVRVRGRYATDVTIPVAERKYEEMTRPWIAAALLLAGCATPSTFEREGFVLIPPGTFLMGSPPDEPGRKPDETQHEVTLTREFYLGRHEVTVGEFRKFVDSTGYVTEVEKAGGGNAHDAKAVWKHTPGTSWRKPGYAGPFAPTDRHPVVHVSYLDARAYCDWLNRTAPVPGWTYGLPTEAEWEYACRAGTTTRYWWGADPDTTGKIVNAGDQALKKVHPEWPRQTMAMNDGHAYAAPVGSYAPNAFGLHDMLGNVWEFCATRHGAYPKEPTTDPGDLGKQESYDVRGGGWSNDPADLRCAARNADPPKFGHSNLGFRVALHRAP